MTPDTDQSKILIVSDDEEDKNDKDIDGDYTFFNKLESGVTSPSFAGESALGVKESNTMPVILIDKVDSIPQKMATN